ncbi:hypothetical protein GJAV_G00053870 [Gymnothorax javanicus]|nr:hypothetical protein GJAV_G00053870 [Gymnothorax javanicus]
MGSRRLSTRCDRTKGEDFGSERDRGKSCSWVACYTFRKTGRYVVRPTCFTFPEVLDAAEDATRSILVIAWPNNSSWCNLRCCAYPLPLKSRSWIATGNKHSKVPLEREQRHKAGPVRARDCLLCNGVRRAALGQSPIVDVLLLAPPGQLHIVPSVRRAVVNPEHLPHPLRPPHPPSDSVLHSKHTRAS